MVRGTSWWVARLVPQLFVMHLVVDFFSLKAPWCPINLLMVGYGAALEQQWINYQCIIHGSAPPPKLLVEAKSDESKRGPRVADLTRLGPMARRILTAGSREPSAAAIAITSFVRCVLNGCSIRVRHKSFAINQ